MQRKVLSAGVVVVRQIRERRHYLLLRAYNYWDFPKGIVEAGERPLEGARREVREETTLDDLRFRWGYEYKETPPYNRGKVARYYIAEAPVGEVFLSVNEELGRPEHEEFRWVTLQQGRAMVSPRVQPILDWAEAMLAQPPRE